MATSLCHGGGFCRQRPQGKRVVAAGKPHCGQTHILLTSVVVQREQIPHAGIRSGILHSQHKPWTVSIISP